MFHFTPEPHLGNIHSWLGSSRPFPSEVKSVQVVNVMSFTVSTRMIFAELTSSLDFHPLHRCPPLCGWNSGLQVELDVLKRVSHKHIIGLIGAGKRKEKPNRFLVLEVRRSYLNCVCGRTDVRREFCTRRRALQGIGLQ